MFRIEYLTLGMLFRVTIILLFILGSATAQQKSDSLFILLAKSKSDTQKITLLNNLAAEICKRDPQEALGHVKQAEALANKSKYVYYRTPTLFTLGEVYSRLGDSTAANKYFRECIKQARLSKNFLYTGKAYNSLAVSERTHGKFDAAVEHANKSILILREMNVPAELAISLNTLGVIQNLMGEYPQSMKTFVEGVELAEKSGDRRVKNLLYSSAGNGFSTLRNYDKAKEYFKKALECKDPGDLVAEASYYLNVGRIFSMQDHNDSALVYYQQSLKFFTETKTYRGMGAVLNNIGGIYDEMRRYDKALLYYRKGIEMKEKAGDRPGLAASYLNMAKVYLNIGSFESSEKWFKKSLAISEEYELAPIIIEVHEGMSSLYQDWGKYKEALIAHKKYTDVRDSVETEENSKFINQLQAKYEAGTREQQIKELEAAKKIDELQLTKQEEKNKKQRYVIILVCLAMVAILIVAYFIYRGYKEKKAAHLLITKEKAEADHQKRLVEEKQKEILDSIHYARRIQRALIMSEKNLERHLNRLKKK